MQSAKEMDLAAWAHAPRPAIHGSRSHGADRRNFRLDIPHSLAFGKDTSTRPGQGKGGQTVKAMMRKLTIAALALAASTAAAPAQDVAAGETSFKSKCQICHDVGEDAKVKLGPPLNGLDGRKAGTEEGFTYNAGIKDSGVTWSEETFKEFVKNPRGRLPDTKMFFAGLKDETEVGNLWAYLKQYGPDGKTR
jgi:cytochrome c